MKRIVNGVTYNTDTSSAVGRKEWTDEVDHEHTVVLYQTRGGAFFLHTLEEWAYKDEFGQWQGKKKNDCLPLTREEAQEWFMKDDTEVLDDSVFDEPPEAEEESEPTVTIYLRVPPALKARIERVAKKNDQSMNEWAMRCLEKCAAPVAVVAE
jgi:hypothetical protein